MIFFAKKYRISLTVSALCCIMRLPPVRQSSRGRHFIEMKNATKIHIAVTALMVVELILSIIYLTRELLR